MLNIVPCAIEWTGFYVVEFLIFNVAWFLCLYLGEIIWSYLQTEADIGLDLPSSNSKDTWDFSTLLLEALYFLLLKLGQIFPTSLIFLVLFWFSVCFFLLLTDTLFFAYFWQTRVSQILSSATFSSHWAHLGPFYQGLKYYLNKLSSPCLCFL